MIEQLRCLRSLSDPSLDLLSPSGGGASGGGEGSFHQVIRRHFFLKKREIREQLGQLTRGATTSTGGLIGGGEHRDRLAVLEGQLLPMLDQLECPDCC